MLNGQRALQKYPYIHGYLCDEFTIFYRNRAVPYTTSVSVVDRIMAGVCLQ